jgi:hypothetical protein
MNSFLLGAGHSLRRKVAFPFPGHAMRAGCYRIRSAAPPGGGGFFRAAPAFFNGAGRGNEGIV